LTGLVNIPDSSFSHSLTLTGAQEKKKADDIEDVENMDANIDNEVDRQQQAADVDTRRRRRLNEN
jgi:hypothetical protein